MLVIPEMRKPGGFSQVVCDSVWLERLSCAGDSLRKIRERLYQLLLLGFAKLTEIDVVQSEGLTIDLAHPKNSTHARVSHLHVIDWILLGLLERNIDIEHQL